MHKYLIYLSMFACMACEPSAPSSGAYSTEIDSLDQFILAYFENNFGYDKDQFIAIKTRTETLLQQGFESARLPWLTSSGLVAFMDVHQTDAIDLYLKALQEAEQRDYTLYIGTLNQEIAKIHFGMRSLENALKYETEAGKIWKGLGLDKRTAHSFNYRGMMHSQLGHTQEALEHFEKALGLFEQLGDTHGILPTLDQIARAHLSNKDYEKALDGFHRAYDHSRALPEFWQMKALQGLAVGYKEKGDLVNALIYFQNGLDIASELDDVEAAFFLMEIGEIYKDQSKPDLALGHLEASLKTFKKHQIKHYESYLHELLAPIYEAKGDYRAAYFNLKDFIPLNDSTNEKNNTEKMARLTAEYESEKKDIQINLQRTELISNKQVQYGLIGGLVFLLVVTVMITKFYLDKQNANREISKQKDIISRSLAERESLLKEIHHRVKNNLQIIASLLYLQSGKFEDEDIKKVLEEGQGRVRSMALIHQKLYENEDLKSISFGEYLTELLSEIKGSFGKNIEAVQIEVDSDDIRFDVETAIPLGLIVNELATNAFKYAFEDKGTGTFSVALKKVGNQFKLLIKDDGKGIPDDVDLRKTKSLGLRLVKMLSTQLEGEYRFESDSGTAFELQFAA